MHTPQATHKHTSGKVFLRITALLILVFTLVGLGGCGYHLGADAPSVLKKDTSTEKLPTLKVKSVDHPTLYPWLTYEVRNRLRDEVNARHLATWVDSGPADYEISLKINAFRYSSHVYDRNDTTLLYDASITLEATIYKGDTNAVVWRSGPVLYNNYYEQVDEKAASNDLLMNLIRILVDKMRQEF